MMMVVMMSVLVGMLMPVIVFVYHNYIVFVLFLLQRYRQPDATRLQIFCI